MKTELTPLQREVLALCADDYTALAHIVKRVAKGSYWEKPLPRWVQDQTIDLVRALLEYELITAGRLRNPNGPEFTRLSLAPSEVVAYINTEWDNLDKTPDIGDICWFSATSQGENLVDELGIRI